MILVLAVAVKSLNIVTASLIKNQKALNKNSELWGGGKIRLKS